MRTRSDRLYRLGRPPTPSSLASWLGLGALCLGLAGCGDKAEDDGVAVDADEDGFTSDEDCDDEDPAVNPDSVETCNGVDDDCDGEIDEADAEGTSTFYADADADGYGDVDQPTQACNEPPNFVDNAEDCDDRDADISPSATETCATVGIDDDCDGTSEDPDAVGAITLYDDDDGDGYGDPSSAFSACEAGAGMTDNGDDCDDTNADTNPDGDEVCDGADNDCDSEIDEADALDATDWYRDADGDGYGDEDLVTQACDQPSGYVRDTTDCDDADGDVHPAMDEYCSTIGTDDDCDGDVDEADAVDASWWYADDDGDGYGDSSPKTKECFQPTGYTDNDDDCDDSDEFINPGMDEYCNGIDDDCDSSTTEEDVATFEDSTGTLTDYSSTFSGTSSSPAAITLSDEGTLTLCEGTYYANLVVEDDVSIVGFTGDAEDVVLNGGANDSVLDMYTDGIEVELTDLTVTNGSGNTGYYGVGTEVGGGLACYSGSVDSLLSLDGVVVEDNDAAFGGGLWAYDCEVEIVDSEFIDNTADSAAGLTMFGGELSIQDTVFTENDATDDAGGLLIWDISGNGVDASFKDIEVYDNTAGGVGGGMAVLDTVVDMAGDTSSSGVGFTENDDAYGAVYIGEDGGINFSDVDFGTSSGGDDNDPVDIYCATSGYSYWYDDDEDLSCDESSCGTSSTETLASDSSSSDVDEGARGNVFIAEDNATIESFAFYLNTNQTGTCSVDFYLLSAASTSSTTWTVESSASGSVKSTTPTWYTATGVGVPVEVGTVYATVIGWSCSGSTELEYYYDQSGSSTSDVDFATTKGRWLLSSGYSTYSSSVTTRYSSDSFRYYNEITWSH